MGMDSKTALSSDALAWLASAREGKVNWLVLAEFLDHLRERGGWITPEAWRAWLDRGSVGLTATYVRRLAACRAFMLETPQLREYLEPADARWAWGSWKPALQATLRGSVVEDLMSLANAQPEAFAAVMTAARGGQKLTAAYVRERHKEAFDAAYGVGDPFNRPAARGEPFAAEWPGQSPPEVDAKRVGRSLAARRRSGVVESSLSLLKNSLADICPGAATVQLTRFDFGAKIARTTAIAIGREGGCLRFLDGFRVATLTARVQVAPLVAEAAHAATRFRHYWLVLVDTDGSVAEMLAELREGLGQRQLATVGVIAVTLGTTPSLAWPILPTADAPIPDQRQDGLERLIDKLLDPLVIKSSSSDGEPIAQG